MFTRLTPAAIAAGFALTACSDLPPPPIGQLELGLASGIGEMRHRLTNATFRIQGAAELELQSDDEPESDVLERALPAGQYSVELLEGWQLERLGELGTSPVRAELLSENPLTFGIAVGETTTLTFQFRTGGTPAPGSDGDEGAVRVEISVDGATAPRIVISEVMKNPDVLADADGEWIELYNAGSAAIDLAGCALERDDQTVTLANSFAMPAGSYATFANGAAPGFIPDVLYSALTLPNTGSFTLRLACGSQLLDTVSFDAALLPNAAGRSLSLSGSALDPRANDIAENWCEGAVSYAGDLGTPGSANPDCAP
jgi:hypothetical protein